MQDESGQLHRDGVIHYTNRTDGIDDIAIDMAIPGPSQAGVREKSFSPKQGELIDETDQQVRDRLTSNRHGIAASEAACTRLLKQSQLKIHHRNRLL